VLLDQGEVAEAKLLKKYGGLEWEDIDNQNIKCHSNTDKFILHGKRSGG